MQQEILRRFYEFCQSTKGAFCDFEAVTDEKEWLNTLLIPEAEPYFKLLGRQKNGSLICFWKYEDGISLGQQPIVWLDSEGSIYSVVAAELPAFLSLLYYDTGAIYDIISAWERYWDAPDEEVSPSESFTDEKLELYIEMCQEIYPFYQPFAQWLCQEMGIESAATPATLVGEAIRGFPRLNAWLSSKHLKLMS
jgi:hypothetical protein